MLIFASQSLTPLPSCPGNTTSADRRTPPPSRPDNTAGIVTLVVMAPLPVSRWWRRCPPVTLVALAFVALASLSDKLASELKKLIVESAALASNGDPLIFDALNELIVGAADIENNSGDASSDTSGGGKVFMGGEEGV
jgi:hypothetical protein